MAKTLPSSWSCKVKSAKNHFCHITAAPIIRHCQSRIAKKKKAIAYKLKYSCLFHCFWQCFPSHIITELPHQGHLQYQIQYRLPDYSYYPPQCVGMVGHQSGGFKVYSNTVTISIERGFSNHVAGNEIVYISSRLGVCFASAVIDCV